MALTIAGTAATPGGGSVRPLMQLGPRVLTAWTGTVTFDNSYPTGGETFDLVTDGVFREVVAVFPAQQSNRIVTYDATNKKLLLYTALGTEAADTSDQSTIVVKVLAFGYC